MKSGNLLKRVLRPLFACALVGMLSGLANANNIRIIGLPIITDQDTLKNTVLIKFDIAWDNSWKTSKPMNHDAAWIFVKCWDGEAWNHVYLEKDGCVPGSTNAADAVNKGVAYSVTDREQKVATMPMVLDPGYSYAWKKWHLNPKEDSVSCIVGYFLYRKDYGAGHVVVPGVTFKWNYGNQGFVDEDDLVVKVFAIEMVYVPEGAYYLGGKGTASWQWGSFTTNGEVFGTPMVITSEAAITCANTTSPNTLWASVDNPATEEIPITAGTIPAEFPKGYSAFYIMKYEMTQQAYCEFLNTLNQGQQDGRIAGDLAKLPVNQWAWGGDIRHYRNFIRVKQAAPVAIFGCDANMNGIYDETDKVKYDYRDTLIRNIDGQDLAVNFVSMMDLLAYADFTGLRPMTELEYEKACRGPREPVNDEYAWGSVTEVFFCHPWNKNDNWTVHNGRVIDANTGTEKVPGGYNAGLTESRSGATSGWWGFWWNANGWETSHPSVLRVGCFADSTTTRAAAGATFWGVMNMTDNVSEMCISVLDTNGRRFKGVHGCGQVDGNGDHITKGWGLIGRDFNQFRYHILKGMSTDYWTTSGNRSYTQEVSANEVVRGTTGHRNWRYTSGMVSSRHWAVRTKEFGLWQRNFTSPTGSMPGIRLVRTEGAAR